MKKTTKNKKPVKNNIAQPTTISAEQDIVGLITTLVQKLVSLEAKIDTVISRLPEKNIELPKQQPQVITNVSTNSAQRLSPSLSSIPIPTLNPTPNVFPQQQKNIRPMYKVICADCKKDCEVPFKPSNGRAVYCKECFTKRKTNRNFIPKVEEKPREVLPIVKPTIAPVAKKQPVTKKPKKKIIKKSKTGK